MYPENSSAFFIMAESDGLTLSAVLPDITKGSAPAVSSMLWGNGTTR